MNIITRYDTKNNSKTEKTEGNAGNKLLKTEKIASKTGKFTNESRKNAFKEGVFGARPFIHLSPTRGVTPHLFGLKFEFNLGGEPTNHGNAFNGETETMSRNSRIRLLKKTSALEFLNEKPTHMLTVTLPPERFEALSNSEKISTWNFAKSFFLRKLEKMLTGTGSKILWFQEFQKRGAPHLHLLLSLKKLSKVEWKEYLDRFVVIWEKALKWDKKEFPRQSVKFEPMKKRDFRYARTYASKLKQKNAPFKGKWGKWWGVSGEWRNVKENEELNFKLPKGIQKEIFEIRGDMSWIAWDKVKELNKTLYEKIMFLRSSKSEGEKEEWSMRRVMKNTFSKEMETLHREREEKIEMKKKEEIENERRKKIAKIRFEAYYKLKKRNWKEWSKKYPLEKFLDMTDEEAQRAFDLIIVISELSKKEGNTKNIRKYTFQWENNAN